ncbi:MAG: hypothetical protein KDI92_05380 [Xanthomonadales bacterium]|nr:hypothetical protein [Xanthomonadales bacterium]
MKFQQAFEQALKEQSFIRIYTEEPDCDYYDGLIMTLTHDYVIILQELDYEFDGYVLIPRQQISGYRQSDVEQFSHKLMLASGEFNTDTSDWIKNSQSFEDVFSQIMNELPWLRVTWVCPNCDNIHDSVANIKSVDDESISAIIYDMTGETDGEMGWSMNKIYSVEFKTRLLERFGRFIEQEITTIQ